MHIIFADLSTESVEVLRDRLNTMKRLMAERQGQANNGKPNAQPSIEDLWNKPQTGHPGNKQIRLLRLFLFI